MHVFTGISFASAVECGDFMTAQGFTPSRDGWQKFDDIDGKIVTMTFVMTFGRCHLKMKVD